LWLRTAEVCVGVIPSLGGRVLSMVTRAGEHLFRNAELLDDALHVAPRAAALVGTPSNALGSWVNWGGDKTWPAPQGWSGPGEWPGPPDPVLDGGPYNASWSFDDSHASVEMLSRDDQRTGLRVGRRVEVAPGRSGYRLTSTFTNSGDREIRWAVWHVVQLPGSRAEANAMPDPGTGIWIGTEPTPDHKARGNGVEHLIAGTSDLSVVQSHSRVAWVPPQQVVGKVGFPSASGWVAHVENGRVSALRFTPEPGAGYPDRGSRVEVWLEYPLSEPLAHLGGLRPTHWVAECEVLGPLLSLAPGSSTQLVTEVTGCSGEGAVCDMSAGACLLGQMTATAGPSGLLVTGRLGIFSTGAVTLRFEDCTGDHLGEVSLGRALAGTSFELGSESQAPRATTEVGLYLGDAVVARAPVNELSE
jgi:hypothetical protein